MAEPELARLDDISVWPKLGCSSGQSTGLPDGSQIYGQDNNRVYQAGTSSTADLEHPEALASSWKTDSPPARLPFQERPGEENSAESGKENTSLRKQQADHETELPLYKEMLESAARQLAAREESIAAYHTRYEEQSNIARNLVAVVEQIRAEADYHRRERNALAKQVTDLQTEVIRQRTRRVDAETRVMQLLAQLRESSCASMSQANALRLSQELSRACQVIEVLRRERDSLKSQLIACLAALTAKQATIDGFSEHRTACSGKPGGSNGATCEADDTIKAFRQMTEELDNKLSLYNDLAERPKSETAIQAAKAWLSSADVQSSNLEGKAVFSAAEYPATEAQSGPAASAAALYSNCTFAHCQPLGSSPSGQALGSASDCREAADGSSAGILPMQGKDFSKADTLIGGAASSSAGHGLPSELGRSLAEEPCLPAVSQMLSEDWSGFATSHSIPDTSRAASVSEMDGRQECDAEQPEARRQRHFRGKRGSGVNRKLWRALGLDLGDQQQHNQPLGAPIVGAYPPLPSTHVAGGQLGVSGSNSHLWGDVLPSMQLQSGIFPGMLSNVSSSQSGHLPATSAGWSFR